MEAYSVEVKNLSTKIVKQMAKALGIEQNEMGILFEEEWQSMRTNYYPPCPQPELVVGLSPHSDGCGITILLQVSEVDGLQIRKDGTWIPVSPLPNAFVINIGDSLEILSNGIYRSIEHRAIVNSFKERLSIATACSPNLEGELGPAPSLITPETPAIFRRIKVEDFFKRRFLRKLDGKSFLDIMRIENEVGNGLLQAELRKGFNFVHCLMIFQIASNGTYYNIDHRATVNSIKEMLSIATFCGPKLDGEFGPAPSLLAPETPAMFRRTRVEDYYK